jgi:hypothetical protein
VEINIPLQTFIQHFALQKTDGTITFPSTIVSYYNGITTEIHSDIEIIVLFDKQFINILNADNKEIPYQFDVEQDIISYVPNLCLRIDKKDEEAIVLIFPKK